MKGVVVAVGVGFRSSSPHLWAKKTRQRFRFRKDQRDVHDHKVFKSKRSKIRNSFYDKGLFLFFLITY